MTILVLRFQYDSSDILTCALKYPHLPAQDCRLVPSSMDAKKLISYHMDSLKKMFI